MLWRRCIKKEKTFRETKRMKQIGSVEIPQEAFLAVLSNEEIDD